MEMVKVLNCNVTNCAYNKSQMCCAVAITVGGSSHPACDTFMSSANKGGGSDMQSGVGACKVSNCQYNQSLQCAAAGIKVGYHEQHADCNTFKQK